MSKDSSFQLLETSPEKIYILKCLNPSKAAAIDNLPGKFLKYGAHVLARLISELCNLSIKLNCFQEVAKLLKLNLSLKKALRPILKTTALFHSSHKSEIQIEKQLITAFRACVTGLLTTN